MRDFEQAVWGEAPLAAHVAGGGGHSERDGGQHEQRAHGLVALRVEALVVEAGAAHQEAATCRGHVPGFRAIEQGLLRVELSQAGSRIAEARATYQEAAILAACGSAFSKQGKA